MSHSLQLYFLVVTCCVHCIATAVSRCWPTWQFSPIIIVSKTAATSYPILSSSSFRPPLPTCYPSLVAYSLPLLLSPSLNGQSTSLVTLDTIPILQTKPFLPRLLCHNRYQTILQSNRRKSTPLSQSPPDQSCKPNGRMLVASWTMPSPPSPPPSRFHNERLPPKLAIELFSLPKLAASPRSTDGV